MNKKIKILLVASLVFVMAASLPMTAQGTVAGARRAAYRIADTFKRLGFGVRDTYQYGLLPRGASHSTRTTLYAGMSYVFIAGGCEDAFDVDVRVYDEQGYLVARDEDHSDVGVAKVTPRWTGSFVVVITMADSTPDGAHWVLVTGWK